MKERGVHALAGALSLAALALVAAAAPAQERASPTVVLNGRAVDAEGRPVAGARVAFFEQTRFIDTSELLAKGAVRTGADGVYRLEAADTYGQVVVALPAHQVCAVMLQHSGSAAAREVETAIMLPGTQLIGRLRDENGDPLAGARVHVRTAIGEYFGSIGTGNLAFVGGAMSDDRGIFAVPGVPSGGLRVTVAKAGYLTRQVIAAQDTPLDLTMEHVGMVRGRVVDGEGQPVAGVQVYAQAVEQSPYVPANTVSSAGDGTFAMSVPVKGRFRITGSSVGPPYRLYSSPLLHGAAKDVQVTPVWQRAGSEELVVVAVDAATGQPIPRFRASLVDGWGGSAQNVLMAHYRERAEFDGEAKFWLQPGARGSCSVVVDAPGHGWEMAPPGKPGEPLTVALGPESVVTGRVLDEDTKQPIAGAAVRAVPKGESSGSGQDPRDAGVFTDVSGRYRVTGLKPGDYCLQAYTPGHPVSRAFAVTAVAETPATCDILIPAQRWLRFSFRGELPPGPPCVMGLGAVRSSGHDPGFFDYPPVPARSSVDVELDRDYEIGPVGYGVRQPTLWKPSRVRLGAGTMFPLPGLDPQGGPVAFDLPELRGEIVYGRVRLPEGVPAERVGVIAQPTGAGDPSASFLVERSVNGAALGPNGDFTLDLPYGSYAVQLADLETGIVFHTDAEDLHVREDTKPIEIEPTVHWLEVELVPAADGEPVVVPGIRLEVPRPRGGALPSILQTGGRSNDRDRGFVPFHPPARSLRWLVPPGLIKLEVTQTFDMLRARSRGYHYDTIDTVEVSIEQPEHRVTVRVPAPPSDEELSREDG